MMNLLNTLGAGIAILVPALVWGLLALGLYELVRESVQESDAYRRLARGTRARQRTA